MKSIGKTAIIITMFTFMFIAANAQKLPNVQQNSVQAPGNIKVDGKAAEWNGQFQAFNHATGIYYTIANNGSNLYLTVQATDAHAIEKILSGGITLTIQSADKKSTALPVSIDYLFVPVIERMAMMRKIRGQEADVPYNADDINKQFVANAKEIQVAGIKELSSDTLISIYNDSGIKVAALFDANKVFTYELGIPLKYLQQSMDANAAFNYNVKLNAVRIIAPRPGSGDRVVAVTSVLRGSKEADDMRDLYSPTDFSGSYTLAKK